MSSKIKVTPKDCLYIDDALSQLCAIKMRICEEKTAVNDSEVRDFLEEVETTFTTHYDAIKKLLKEAQ